MKANPKDAASGRKVHLSLVPPAALVSIARVMENGALKYGRMNWRKHKVSRLSHIDAVLRHIMADMDGEDLDRESGLPHLAHAAAGLLILLDAAASGCLLDDRPAEKGAFADAMATDMARLDRIDSSWAVFTARHHRELWANQDKDGSKE